MTEEMLTKGERTRQAIIEAAYSLIIEQGYAGTSMRQIAGKAGLALGGIYNHFSSKEEVFQAIIEDRHPFFKIVPILNEVQGESVEEFVRNAAHTLVEQLGHYPEFLNLMLTEIVEFKAAHLPLMYKKIFPMLLPITQRLTSLDGSTRQIPIPMIMRAFLGMFISYYITELLIGRALPPEMLANSMDYFVDIFLHGILVEEAV